jgi:hypothetical protein
MGWIALRQGWWVICAGLLEQHLLVLTMPGLDPGILFAVTKKDRRVKPGDGERVCGVRSEHRLIHFHHRPYSGDDPGMQ